MQDINPVRRTIPVSESPEPDNTDIRASVGIQVDESTSEKANEAREVERSSIPLKPREQVAFSSLYTPSSRKNSLPKKDNSYLRPAKPKKKNNNILFFFIGTIIFLSFVLYTFVFSSAKVIVTPTRTTIPVDQTIVVPSIDVQIGNDIVVIIASSTDSVDIPRRGETKVESKASGVITIFNNSSAAPQRLITNTRFESKTGKIYRIAESVTVPGMKGSTPGSIDVTVFADSVGADYNVTSADFTIPGFKGTALFNKFSAKTKGPISGGASGTQSTVADEDLEAAHASILAELNKKIALEIESKKPSDEFIYLPDATIYSTTNNKKELVSDPKLKYTETITAKAIFIKKEYLAKKILENTSHTEDEKLRLESTEQLVFGVPTKEAQAGKDDIVFTVTGSPSFIADIDTFAISTRLLGIPKSQFVERMKEFSGIEKAEPKFNPIWISRFPNDTNRVKIEISNK
jgi:hypothetical protein